MRDAITRETADAGTDGRARQGRSGLIADHRPGQRAQEGATTSIRRCAVGGIGVWLVRTARVVPDNERWLQHSEASNDLRNALAWAQNNAPDDSGVDDFMAQIGQ